MANPQGSASFIPKSPAKGKVKTRGVRKIYLLNYFSFILFFGTLIATVAVFLYNFSLTTELKNQQEQLRTVSESFSQSDLERVRELDHRINTATEQLNNHVSLLSIFEGLENSIIDPVKLLGFEYLRPQLNEPQIRLIAQTDSFNTLLSQKETFETNQSFQTLELSEIGLQTLPIDSTRLELGTEQVVSVTLSAMLDKSKVNFKKASIFVESVNSQPVSEETTEVIDGTTGESEGAEEIPATEEGSADNFIE